MNYNDLLDKLTRVIEYCGVKATFIEDSIGIGRSTLNHYRKERLRFREDTQGRLKKVLDMYNI